MVVILGTTGDEIQVSGVQRQARRERVAARQHGRITDGGLVLTLVAGQLHLGVTGRYRVVLERHVCFIVVIGVAVFVTDVPQRKFKAQRLLLAYVPQGLGGKAGFSGDVVQCRLPEKNSDSTWLVTESGFVNAQ